MEINNYQFEKTVHAKCILVGEHAVMRGHSGLVFPIRHKSLSLFYQPDKALTASFDAPCGETLLVLFWKVMETCEKLLSKKNIKISGKFCIKNDIPMASGMGFSSAICVAVTYWILWKGWINNKKVFNFAQTLENIFHGKSSGIDIAGVIRDDAIIFNMREGIKELKLNWQPHLYISPTEFSCDTSSCIKQVEKLWTNNKKLAAKIDKRMALSVVLAQEALSYDEKKGLPLLAQAVIMAYTCFQEWELIPVPLQREIDYLLTAGAIAAKPTGSGGGGYIISLWNELPKPNLGLEMIPIL